MISEPPKRRFNPILMTVILISLGLHLLALLIFGSYTLVKLALPTEAEFEEPPSVEEVEPPPDVKVEIKPQNAPQEQAMENLRMKQVGNISVAAVDVDLPSMEQSFTVNSGLGGFGGGSLVGTARGNIGLGVSDVDFLGLKSRAERVLFAVDASKHMLVDEKGGLNSYDTIKEEITSEVRKLSVGTLFNVVFFDNGRLLYFKPKPVSAGGEISDELEKWIEPINADIDSLGLRDPERPGLETLPEHPVHQAITGRTWHGTNELMYLTQIFLEQAIDAAFIVTGDPLGFDKVRREPTEEEDAEWEEITEDPKYQEALKLYQAESDSVNKKAREKLRKLNEERKKKGIPPKVVTGALWRAMGIEREHPHPGHRPAYFIEEREVEDYMDEVVDVLYEQKGGQPPSMNVVLFLAGDEKISDEKEDRVKDYVRYFDGDYRIIRGLDEIKSAAGD
ncbi:MAG: hypothetical protein ACLFVC_05340 [Opitutales bacterium]